MLQCFPFITLLGGKTSLTFFWQWNNCSVGLEIAAHILLVGKWVQTYGNKTKGPHTLLSLIYTALPGCIGNVTLKFQNSLWNYEFLKHQLCLQQKKSYLSINRKKCVRNACSSSEWYSEAEKDSRFSPARKFGQRLWSLFTDLKMGKKISPSVHRISSLKLM